MKRTLMSRKDGSAMVGAIIVAIVVGTWVAASVSSTYTEYKLSKHYFDAQGALNLAESGLEEGVRLLHSGEWGANGWASHGAGAYSKSFVPTMSDSTDSKINVFVQDDATSPVIVAEGVVSVSGGKSISRQIKVELNAESSGSSDAGYTPFANALLAKREVIFNGNRILVDSYDSTKGDWTPSDTTNRFSNGHVVSLVVSNPSTLINNGDIRGHVSVGSKTWSDSVVGPNGSVHSYDWAGAGRIDHSLITPDFYMNLEPANAPTVDATIPELTLAGTSTTIGSPTSIGPEEYQAERIQLSGSDEIVIDGHVRLYVQRNVSLSGNSKFTITDRGKLELFARESISLKGNGVANTSKKPAKFIVWGGDMEHQSIDIGGNASVYGVVYAPNANVHMHGGGSSPYDMHGAVVANQITLSGHWNFHYDEDLKNFSGGGDGAEVVGDGKLSLNRWRELKGANERVDFGNPAAIADAI